MKVVVGKPHMRGPVSLESHSTSGVGIAVLLSGSVKGRVKIYFTKSVALSLAGSLSGTTHESVDESTQDALREVANMIVGSAKREFPGGLTKISPPKVVSNGQDDWTNERNILVVPLQCMAGAMQIEVKIQSVEAKPAVEVPKFQPGVDASQVNDLVERLLKAS